MADPSGEVKYQDEGFIDHIVTGIENADKSIVINGFPDYTNRDFERAILTAAAGSSEKDGERVKVCAVLPKAVITSPMREAYRTIESFQLFGVQDTCASGYAVVDDKEVFVWNQSTGWSTYDANFPDMATHYKDLFLQYVASLLDRRHKEIPRH